MLFRFAVFFYTLPFKILIFSASVIMCELAQIATTISILLSSATASEATLMALLSARTKCIEHELSRDPTQTNHKIASRMVAYASKCSHSSVERAGNNANCPKLVH